MEQLDQLFQIDVHHLVLELFLIAVVFLSVDDIYHKIKGRLGILTKQEIQKQKEQEAIERHSCELEEIKASLIAVREESEKADNEFKTQFKAINDKINVLSRILVEMQQKDDESERHKLHDRIAQSYRYYHERYVSGAEEGVWTEMEKLAFNGLIQDYENHGGKNSFVHDKCQPESALWSIKGE